MLLTLITFLIAWIITSFSWALSKDTRQSLLLFSNNLYLAVIAMCCIEIALHV